MCKVSIFREPPLAGGEQGRGQAAARLDGLLPAALRGSPRSLGSVECGEEATGAHTT